MLKKHIILLYLTVIFILIPQYPSYGQVNESIVRYIVDLSDTLHNSIQNPPQSIIDDSRGELVLRLLLSPWGELKDAYIHETSSNETLDNLCLKAVWLHERYQPFPESLGEDELWLDVPIIFEVREKDDPDAGTSPQGKIIETDQRITGLSVGEAVDIALENAMSTKIAKEEIELSRLKIRESRRALYPAASLNYLETIGKTAGTTQDFTDKEYKVKFEYPLYYGWRLKYAVAQAISNMKASKENYNKVVQDIRVDVETAFYSYAVNKVNVELHRSLLEKAGEIFDIAEKRYDIGLSTRSEFLQVQSQLEQIKYQVASSESEMDMSGLTLALAMGVEDAGLLKDFFDIRIDFMDLKPLDLDITLDECIELAFRHRPDLRAKEYMIEFNDYEHKIARSKDQFRVDLSGSYGRSGGAFQTEPLVLDTDWFVGVKLSKPLGGNTVSTSYTEDKTSQKHGQTTRTESVSKSMEFGILDNLQGFSEKKSARIALEKAKDELKKTRDGILKEVKDSYLNFKKGLVQARTNLNKIKYREEELKVINAHAELNEVPLSSLLQAHTSLTDEKSFYIEALGSFYQSLVKLNRATGYSLFLDDEGFMLADTNERQENRLWR